MESIEKVLKNLNSELDQRKKILEFQKQAFKKILEEMNEKTYHNEYKNSQKETD